MTTLLNEIDRIESAADRPSGTPGPKDRHHYYVGQSPENPDLNGIWLHTMLRKNIYVADFRTHREASMSAAALNRARPFEGPILRLISAPQDRRRAA